MINPEYQVFDKVSKEMKKRHPHCFMTTDEISGDSKLPAVQFYMDNNYIRRDMSDSGSVENAAQVSFVAYAYSGISRYEAYCILNDIDEIMQEIGFVRKNIFAIANYDKTIHRVRAGWSAMVTKNFEIGR